MSIDDDKNTTYMVNKLLVTFQKYINNQQVVKNVEICNFNAINKIHGIPVYITLELNENNQSSNLTKKYTLTFKIINKYTYLALKNNIIELFNTIIDENLDVNTLTSSDVNIILTKVLNIIKDLKITTLCNVFYIDDIYSDKIGFRLELLYFKQNEMSHVTLYDKGCNICNNLTSDCNNFNKSCKGCNKTLCIICMSKDECPLCEQDFR